MATIAGKDADLSVAGHDYKAHEWTMDIDADALEDTNWDWTSYDVGWRSFISGLKGFSGSFACFIDTAHIFLPGTLISDAKFYVSLAGTIGFKGDILVTAVHPSVAIDGIAELSVDYQGTGSLVAGNVG
jgi:hypothetical protein